jgi:stage V sporulation protein B
MEEIPKGQSGAVKPGESRNPRQEPVAKGAVYISLARLVMLVAGMILQIALARMLGVELYGLYGLLFSLLVWFELFMLGMNKASAMEVAKAPAEARSFQHTALKIQAVFGVVILAFGIAASFFLPVLFDRPGTTHYFIIAFLDIPLIGVLYIYQGMLNGLRLYRYQAMTITLYYLARLVFSILLVGIGLSITGALVANIICSLVGWVFAIRFFLLYSEKPGEHSSTTVRELLKTTVPFIILPLIFNVIIFVSLWVVASLSSEAELGFYTAAFSMTRLLLVFFASLTTALFPALTASLSMGDTKRSVRLVKVSFRFLLILIAPACLFLAMTADTAMKIFGAKYTGGSDAMSLLAFGFFILAFFHLMNYMQMAARHFWRVIIINLIVVTAELACALILTSRMGLEGAAISLLLAALLGCTIQLGFTSRQFTAPLSIDSTFRIIAAAGISAAILIPIDSLWLLIPAYAFSFALYLLLLSYFREMDIKEMRYWVGVLLRREPISPPA